MIFGVMRHAKAEPGVPGKPDAERRLVEEGRRQIEALAGILPWRPARILSSPYRRAVETAEILARLVGVGSIDVDDRLSPEKFNLGVLKELAEEGVLLIGHAPSVEEALSGLLGCRIKMKTGSLALLEYDNGEATLLALLVPPTSKIP